MMFVEHLVFLSSINNAIRKTNNRNYNPDHISKFSYTYSCVYKRLLRRENEGLAF